MNKFTRFALVLSFVLGSQAWAFDMSDVCQAVASDFVQREFQKEFHSPNTWAHQVWQVRTNSARGGCGVVDLQLIGKSFDR